MEQIITQKTGKKLGILLFSLILLLCLLIISNMANPVMDFVDQGLENAIREKLGKEFGPIYKNDVVMITSLDAAGYGIRSLEGIHELSRLTSLDLSDNWVEDLSPLADLDMLSELHLRNNGITDLESIHFDQITHLPIRTLNLRHNVTHTGERLSEIGLLDGMMQLESLDLRDNHISDLTSLTFIPNLQILDLRENHISDLEPLRKIQTLSELNLRENNIRNIEPVSSLKGLAYLNIHSNPIESGLETLANLENLQTLIMRNVYIGENDRFLTELTNLRRLNIRSTSISDLSVIAKLMQAGALQDDQSSGIYATVDILENDPPRDHPDPYHMLRPYWDNIAYRYPINLPYYPSSVAPPVFSHASNFYSEEFYLALSTDEPEFQIFFTLDGSEPVITHTLMPLNTTQLYNRPILVKSRANDPNVLSNIQTRHRESKPYFPPSPVFKGTVVRAIVVDKNGNKSNIVTHSYFIDQEMDARYTFPVISIATDAHRLFDDDIGIYVPGDRFENIYPNRNHDPGNYTERGLKWERPIYFQMFSPTGELLLEQNAGLRIHGSGSRWYAQKSLRLYTGDSYDECGLFQHDFFPALNNRVGDGIVDTFETLILRNSGQDWYWPIPTMFKDAMTQSLLEHTTLDIQGYQPIILFLNGEYWGIHNIRTRYDEYYFKSYYGLSANQVTVLEENSSLKFGDGAGLRHYLNLLSAIDPDFHSNDFQTVNTLADPDQYAQIAKWMDIDNFIDYYVSQIYFNNSDWPGKNVLYWRKMVDEGAVESDPAYGHDGKWRWMIIDTDFGFRDPERNALFEATRDDGTQWYNQPWSTFLARSLLQNQDFRIAFINRFADHLNTTFREDVVLDKVNTFTDLYQPEIEEQIHRWGNLNGSEKAWLENVEIMREFALIRPGYQRQHLLEMFFLPGTAELTVRVNSSHGYLQVNSLVIKDGQVGVKEANNWTGIYFQDVPVQLTAIPFEGYQFLRWETQDGTTLGTETPTISLRLSGDIQITAVFIEN
jgi:hypothetical protein